MASIKRSVTQIYQDANSAYNEGRWQNAIDGWYQVLATGKAKQPEAFHFNCASAYTNMQKFDKAIEEYNTCIKLSPGHQQALLRRSAILHKTHKFEEALSGYNQLLELGMHSQNIFVQKLNVLNILDRFENTMEIVESALKLAKDEGTGPISENLSFNAEVAFALCKLKNVDTAYAEELLPYAKFLERMNNNACVNLAMDAVAEVQWCYVSPTCENSRPVDNMNIHTKNCTQGSDKRLRDMDPKELLRLAERHKLDAGVLARRAIR